MSSGEGALVSLVVIDQVAPVDWLFVVVGDRVALVGHVTKQGINLKGCLYFIGKGNLEYSLSNEGLPQKLPSMYVFQCHQPTIIDGLGCFFEDMSVLI